MEPLDREAAKVLFERYRGQRDGVRTAPEMATVCLICGSTHIETVDGDDTKSVCLDCGFAFYRYECGACGETIDGRDPKNPGCRHCGARICTCGACGCPPGNTPT